MSKPLPPGSTIGLLGGGQLGRMIALEGRSLGYRFVCWDPVAGAPSAAVCDDAVTAPFDDPAAKTRFAELCDVITFEWENVPAELVEQLQTKCPVRPDASVLAVVQDRLIQRQFLSKHGFPQTEYRSVDSRARLEDALKSIGTPSILKTRRHGYDGKGQTPLRSAQDAAALPDALHHILEKRVSFVKEISVVLARTEDGKTATFPVAENVHRNGILHTTLAPARVPASVERQAALLAVSIANELEHVGVMAVEMFWLGGEGNDQVLVNEIAPRVHNSGHYTWGACRTSQFEQHVRAVAGLPLGDVTQHTPAVMINLLGDVWAKGEPDWSAALSRGAKLYLYGKEQAKPGRKMGHLLLLGDAERSLAQADELLRLLAR